MSIITVTSNADSGPGTLRQAMMDAQNTDTIVFAPSLNGATITLATSLQLNKGITIDGTGANITISGANAVTDFIVANTSAVKATLRNLTIADGNGMGAAGTAGQNGVGGNGGPGSDAAGGVYAYLGKLSLEGDKFVNDTATGGTGGAGGDFPEDIAGNGGNGGDAAGAVFVESGATVTASNLTFTNDTAHGGAGGQPGGTGIDGGNPGNPGTAYSNANSDAVNEAAVCFISGTAIRTARGEVPVEDLHVGDRVVTASGVHRPIRWLGHRTVDCAGRTSRAHVLPIRIAAHAFGAGLPERDLFLSPGHPVLVGADEDGEGGHLVPIMCLINGTTVRRVAVDSVTYWHVELDAHDILLAEGLPAESYLDWGDRAFFSEAPAHALMNPDFVVPGLTGRCRPVAVDGPVVDAERLRLDTVFAMRLATACAWPHAAAALAD